MIRNLKILIAAAMALAALGAISAGGASAAEYHCTVEPCRVTLKPDGTGKTTHQVFILKGKNGAGEAVSGSFTCNELDGTGLANTKTTKELTITGATPTGCSIAGTPTTIDMNGCDSLFIAGPPSTVTIKCPAGKQIESTILSAGVLKCTIDTPAQGPLTGVTYHDANTGGVPKTELTIETLIKDVTGINATPAAGGSCIPYVGFNGLATEGEYTTGNTIVTGETTAGVHGSVWYE